MTSSYDPIHRRRASLIPLFIANYRRACFFWWESIAWEEPHLRPSRLERLLDLDVFLDLDLDNTWPSDLSWAISVYFERSTLAEWAWICYCFGPSGISKLRKHICYCSGISATILYMFRYISETFWICYFSENCSGMVFWIVSKSIVASIFCQVLVVFVISSFLGNHSMRFYSSFCHDY